MRVLLANKFFFENGGSETVMFQEREFLKRSGVYVVDFSMNDKRNCASSFSEYFVSPKVYDHKGATIRSLESAISMIHSFEATYRLAELIKKERPDIMHCHNIYHQLTPSIIKVAKSHGLRVVLTLHDYKVICPVYTRHNGISPCDACELGDFSQVVWRRCSDFSLGRSAILYAEALIHRLLGSYGAVDKVIAPSHYMAEVVSRWRFPKDKVVVLPNGVNAESLTAPSAHDGYILYFGRLSYEKGLVTLGRAQRESGMRVVVAGKGPLEGLLRRNFPGLQLVGHQIGDDLRTLVAGAAAVIVPSEWHENCPMAVLEAMAAGKPVIGSRIGGIPEMVIDQQTGMLFEPGDAASLRRCMEAILSAPQDDWRTMGQRAQEYAKRKYSLESHNRRLMEVYETLLAGT